MSERRLAMRYSQLPMEYKDKQTSVQIFREVLAFVAAHAALPQCAKQGDRQTERNLYRKFQRARRRQPLSALELQLLAGEECCGRNPYPGLSNLGNACYLNAVLQALMHCGPARSELLRLASHPADVGRLSEQLCTAVGYVVGDCWIMRSLMSMRRRMLSVSFVQQRRCTRLGTSTMHAKLWSAFFIVPDSVGQFLASALRETATACCMHTLKRTT